MNVFPTRRFVQPWRRHFLVWRKTFAASLMGSLGEPLLYLLGLGYGLGKFIGEVEGVPYLFYLAAGILAGNSMNAATFEALYGGFTRMTRQYTFHAMLATPLSVADVVAGEIAWAASKSLISGSAIYLVGVGLGIFSPWQGLAALPVVFLSGLVFASLAMTVTAISPNYEFFMYYFTLVTTPMFLFCGVFFPADGLPQAVQGVVQLLPLSHVAALIRPLSAGVVPEDAWMHLSALAGYFVVAGSLAVRLVQRRMVR
ncbi:MAG: ABC transporter permease [Magnetococcales bacterium]|nr:ABC transporter permease [Magnetococcales bacterium]